MGFVHTSDFRRFMSFVRFFREIRRSYISLHPAYTSLFPCWVNFRNPYFSVSTAPRSAFKEIRVLRGYTPMPTLLCRLDLFGILDFWSIRSRRRDPLHDEFPVTFLCMLPCLTTLPLGIKPPPDLYANVSSLWIPHLPSLPHKHGTHFFVSLCALCVRPLGACIAHTCFECRNIWHSKASYTYRWSYCFFFGISHALWLMVILRIPGNLVPPWLVTSPCCIPFP